MKPAEHLTLQLNRLKRPEEFAPHPDGLTFIFAKDGVGKCVTRTGTQRLLAGDVLVLNSAAGGKFSVGDLGEFHFWHFSLCFENLLPLFSGNEISLLHTIAESYKAAKTYPASQPLSVECHRLLAVVPPQANLDHRGQLIRIATTVLSADFKLAQTQRSGYVRSEDHMIQIFEQLTADELINFSVGELADKFSCSRRHLNRLFHQHFGVAVASLRMEMRLLKAMSLLRDPEAKVINVAEECGFNHLGLFNTCFKRRFGTAPGQWRKAAIDQDNKTQGADHKSSVKVPCPLHVSGLCPWVGKTDAHPPPGIMHAMPTRLADKANAAELPELLNPNLGADLPMAPKRSARPTRSKNLT